MKIATTIKVYGLAELARTTGVSESTLRKWRERSWLKPYAVVGEDFRYTMDGFDRAAQASLRYRTKRSDLQGSPEDYDNVVKQHGFQ